jgi:hypothetical protein
MHVNKLISFSFAKDFLDTGSGNRFTYEKNFFEKFGGGLNLLSRRVIHITLKEINNPVCIVALTVIAFLAVTVIFYPEVIVGFIPHLAKVQPWVVKGGVYLIFQITIFGHGIQTYGRVTNSQLREKWNAGELNPMYPGDRRAR